MMYETPRKFIEALGGYKVVAPRLGMAATTLHTHICAGLIPAKFYKASCQLAAEMNIAPPTQSLFSFSALCERPQEVGATQDKAERAA